MTKIRIPLVILLVASLGSAFGRPAAAASSFKFFGGGYGHGVGMSQYGALGLAQEGWDHKDILTHFYTGTTVEQHTLPRSIRVGLVQGAKIFSLTAKGGPVELHVGKASGPLVGTIPAEETWKVRTGTGRYRIMDASKALAGGHAWGGTTAKLVAVYNKANAMVKIKQAGGVTYNRGRIEFNIYGDSNRGRLIAILDPQDYLYGIGEVPSEWPAQALMAQAVAARTYAFEIVERVGQRQKWCNCAVTDDTRNQVYVAYAKEGGTKGDRWVAAVDSTDGEVVLYEGELIQAQYMSSDGGYTENVENVWHGSPLPYLRGVCDPGDYATDNPNSVWRKDFTAAEATAALKGVTGDIGTVTSFANYVRGVSGRIISVDVVGSGGKNSISGSELRTALGLADDRVWINSNLSVTDEIRDKYDSLDCAPGLAASPRSDVAGGQEQGFADGTIYFQSVPGAHWIRGRVLEYYVAQGGPGGHLGFPTGDTDTASDGTSSAIFQHGEIVCAPAPAACSEV